MNRKVLFLSAAVLAGGILVYLASKTGGKAADPVASKPVPASSKSPASDPRETPSRVAATAPVPRDVATNPVNPGAAGASSAWARLAAQYGPERTAQSGKITSDLAEVLDLGMELADTGARNAGSASLAEAASKGVLRRIAPQLGLTEDQQQAASSLIQDAVGARMNAVTELVSAMRSEPEQMMELLLAGDALSRNAMTQDEYDHLTLPTRTMLGNLGGFVMGDAGLGGGAQLLGNDEVARQLNAILTPEQQVKLAEITAKAAEQAQARQARAGGTAMPFQNGQLPVMDLDRLDQSVASVRKMEEAAQLMMEAMEGLKNANPTFPSAHP